MYVVDCVNASQRWLKPFDGRREARQAEEAAYPWRDPFGDGRWLRQAFTPSRRDAPLSEAELSQKNLELARRLEADGAESAAKGHCAGRGLFTPVVPLVGRRWKVNRQAPDTKVCHCFPGWYGEACEHGPGSARAGCGVL